MEGGDWLGKGTGTFWGVEMCSQYLLRDMEYTAVGICQSSPKSTLQLYVFSCISI